MIKFLKKKMAAVLIALGALAAGIGAVYGFADSISFDLDRPAWKSELDVQGEVVYDLAQSSILNQLDRAERRYDSLQRRRSDPKVIHTPRARKDMDQDIKLYRRKIQDLKSQYNQYNVRRKR